MGSECVAPAGTACGSGTTLQNGACVTTVAMVSCGTGTVASGSTCVGTLQCGAGTMLAGGACVGTLGCGSGTQQVGMSCQGTVSCGSGTANSGGSCLPILGLICGTDTAPANGNTTCVSTVTCGPNTQRVGTQCVSVGGACGSGTVLQNGTCVVLTPATGLTAFVQQAGLRSASSSRPSMVIGGFTAPSYRNVILTDFAQIFADSYVQNGTAPVGTGKALHFALHEAVITNLTVSVVNDVQADGGCRPIDPRTLPASDGLIRLVYGDWVSTNFTRLACGRGGVAQIVQMGNTLQVTMNAQFSDGTLLQNQMITLPY
jgi:hypothetical protein